MQRATLFALSLLVLLATSAVSANGPTVSVKTSVLTAKMLDIGIVLYDKPISEVILFVDWPNGFGIDIYHSTGLGRCLENETCASQEMDLEAYWAGKIGKNWQALVQGSYFAMGHLNNTRDADTAQVKARLQYAGWAVQPFVDVRAQYFLPTGEAGLAYSAIGADWSAQTRLGTLSLTGLVAYDSTPFLPNHGLLGEVDIGLWHPLGKSAQLGIWGKWIAPITDFNGEKRGDVVGGVGFKYAF